MVFQEVATLAPEIRKQIRAIWNATYPKVIEEKTQEKFDVYIDSLADARHVLVFDAQNRLKGWYADFERESDRWFLVILSSELHGKGIGKQLIQNAQQKHHRLNGWAIFSDEYEKVDGTLYKNPIGFYEKLGFQIRRDIVFETAIMKTLKIEWRKSTS